MNKVKYDVNIDLANETKKEMAKTLETGDKKVLNKMTDFASLYHIDLSNYKEPVLALKTEEPGSKQLLAAENNKLDGVTYDMINHLINDCICMGAKPLTVQDAIICGKINKEDINKIVKAAADACKEQGCILTGGETSEQPGVLPENRYILTSSVVGVVEKSKIIDGSKIEEGDIVLSLASSGIHSNGYTLIRTLMEKYPEILEEKIDGKSFMDTILIPHRCYYNTLQKLFDEDIILGLAHITGGGICENLDRILPNNLDAEIDISKYEINEIFKVIKRYSNVSDDEMLRTYNLGVGMALVTKRENVEYITKTIEEKNIGCKEIGKIVKGNKKVQIKGTLNW